MNTRFLLLPAAALAAAFLSPVSATASDRGDKVGAFVAGVIVGAITADADVRCGPPPPACPPRGGRHDRDDRWHRDPPRHGGPVVIIQPPRCDPPPVRVWVPARWVITRDACGRLVRVYEPGHYEVRGGYAHRPDRRDRRG